MADELPLASGDWRDFRYAAERAEPRWNDLSVAERERLWKFANDFAANFPRLKSRCIQCRRQFDWHKIYRCADCHAPLCGTCIRPHFLNERSPAESNFDITTATLQLYSEDNSHIVQISFGEREQAERVFEWLDAGAASAIEARSDETAEQVQPVGQERGGEAETPKTSDTPDGGQS